MEVKGGFIDPALVVGKVGAPAVAGFKPAALKPALMATPRMVTVWASQRGITAA